VSYDTRKAPAQFFGPSLATETLDLPQNMSMHSHEIVRPWGFGGSLIYDIMVSNLKNVSAQLYDVVFFRKTAGHSIGHLK
jgi:hypothetical protein